MSGLLLTGTGLSGPQQFQMPTVIDQSTGRQFSVPVNRGVYSYIACGLLQWICSGPALFDTLPHGRPTAFQPLIAAGCIVTSTPTSIGQQLVITDAAGNTIEKWIVQLVALIPLGPQVPQWCGSAFFTGAAYTSPFTISSSGFQPSDTWTFSIPGMIRG